MFLDNIIFNKPETNTLNENVIEIFNENMLSNDICNDVHTKLLESYTDLLTVQIQIMNEQYSSMLNESEDSSKSSFVNKAIEAVKQFLKKLIEGINQLIQWISTKLISVFKSITTLIINVRKKFSSSNSKKVFVKKRKKDIVKETRDLIKQTDEVLNDVIKVSPDDAVGEYLDNLRLDTRNRMLQNRIEIINKINSEYIENISNSVTVSYEKDEISTALNEIDAMLEELEPKKVVEEVAKKHNEIIVLTDKIKKSIDFCKKDIERCQKQFISIEKGFDTGMTRDSEDSRGSIAFYKERAIALNNLLSFYNKALKIITNESNVNMKIIKDIQLVEESLLKYANDEGSTASAKARMEYIQKKEIPKLKNKLKSTTDPDEREDIELDIIDLERSIKKLKDNKSTHKSDLVKKINRIINKYK